MSDDNNNPPPANLTELTEKITQLSAQLEQAKTALTERDTKIQELEGTTGGFKTANGQLTTKVTELETQLATAQKAIETQTGELTNWTTKFDQLNQAHTTLTTEAAVSKQQLQLYGLIAGDAKYHSLIGVVDAIKTESDPARQKEILDKMAGSFTAQTNQMLDAFRAGGTLPAGNAGGTQPGGSLPSDPKVAFTEYQQLLGTSTPEAINRRAALYEVITAAQFGENGKQQN
jgi:hypothetical protein